MGIDWVGNEPRLDTDTIDTSYLVCSPESGVVTDPRGT